MKHLLFSILAMGFFSFSTSHSHSSSLAPHTLTPRSADVLVELGTNKINVGDMSSSVIYDSVYHTLKSACPFRAFTDKACKGTMGKFTIYTEIGSAATLVARDFKLDVKSADWHGNQAVYYLLIGAVAAGFERGTWNVEEHCWNPWIKMKNNKWIEVELCHTTDWVNVTFPGGNHMEVKASVDVPEVPNHDFICSTIKDAVYDEIHRLLPEIEAALGTGQWSDVVCKY
jgi:hypothetical protein